MFDLIPIISVNHTGSNSVADRFRSQLPNYKFISGNKLKYLKSGIFSGKYHLDKTRGNIIKGIIGGQTLDFIIHTSQEYRLVVPMRDPLLCLITDKLWYSSSEHIMHDFLLWAGWIFPLNPFHIPVDLDTSDLTYKGVNFKDLNIVNRTKDRKPNTYSKTDDLRKAYYSKDSKFLFSNFENFRILCTLEFPLRPKLEELGYRDLLWWDIRSSLPQRLKTKEM